MKPEALAKHTVVKEKYSPRKGVYTEKVKMHRFKGRAKAGKVMDNT